jgi:uncharacterized membrane protein required for colicin V production
MTSIIALIAVFVLLLLMTYAGYRDGVFATVYALLRNLFGFLCAMMFCEPLARQLTGAITRAHPAYDYFVAISFAAILAAAFALGRWLKVRYTVPGVVSITLVDRIAGPALGLLNGIVVTGTLLVLWSLMPFAKFVPGDLGRAEVTKPALDTGSRMLSFYEYESKRMPGGTVFLLQDEPLKTDENMNGKGDAGDSFDDKNGNGQWDRGWLYKYRHHATILPADLQQLPGVMGG